MKKTKTIYAKCLCVVLFVLCLSLGSYLGLGVAFAKNSPAKNHIDELMDAANMGQIARVKSLVASGVDTTS